MVHWYYLGEWKGLVEKAYREAAAKAPGDMRGRKRQSAKGRTLDLAKVEKAMLEIWQEQGTVSQPLWGLNCLVYTGKHGRRHEL